MKVFIAGRSFRKSVACCDSKNEVKHQDYRWENLGNHSVLHAVSAQLLLT